MRQILHDFRVIDDIFAPIGEYSLFFDKIKGGFVIIYHFVIKRIINQNCSPQPPSS
jgi:hypothetical protein